MAESTIQWTSQLGVNITINDTIFTIQEGDKLFNLSYNDGHDNVVTVEECVLRVIIARVHDTNVVLGTPPESYYRNLIGIMSIIIDYSEEFNANYVTVDIEDIVALDSTSNTGGSGNGDGTVSGTFPDVDGDGQPDVIWGRF